MNVAGILIAIAVTACTTTNPFEGYDVTVEVRSPIALDGLKVYYDTTGGSLPGSPAPTAAELANGDAASEWSNVLALDTVAAPQPAQTITYRNHGHGPQFIAILGIRGATAVDGGTLEISYLDGPDSDPLPTAIANETLDLVAF